MKSNAKNQIDSRLPKPPKPPEKPLMPYMRYSRKVWEQVKTANPELKLWEVGKIIGQMWRELAEEEKARFTEDYETEKAQYNEAMRQYHNSPAYQTWLAAKERAEKALEEPEPERTKATPTKVRERVSDGGGDAREAYIIEDNEDDADDQLTAKHVSAARYHRNHCLMQEVLSDARLPEVRSIISRQRLLTLKRQVDQLEGHREKLSSDMDTCEVKHKAKVARMQSVTDTFYQSYKKVVADRPVITDKLYMELVEKAQIDLIAEEKQRRIDQERRAREAETRAKSVESRRKTEQERQKHMEEEQRRAQVDRVIQQVQVVVPIDTDAKAKKTPAKKKKATKPRGADNELGGEVPLLQTQGQTQFGCQQQGQQMGAQWQSPYGQQQYQVYQGSGQPQIQQQAPVTFHNQQGAPLMQQQCGQAQILQQTPIAFQNQPSAPQMQQQAQVPFHNQQAAPQMQQQLPVVFQNQTSAPQMQQQPTVAFQNQQSAPDMHQQTATAFQNQPGALQMQQQHPVAFQNQPNAPQIQQQPPIPFQNQSCVNQMQPFQNQTQQSPTTFQNQSQPIMHQQQPSATFQSQNPQTQSCDSFQVQTQQVQINTVGYHIQSQSTPPSQIQNNAEIELHQSSIISDIIENSVVATGENIQPQLPISSSEPSSIAEDTQ